MPHIHRIIDNAIQYTDDILLSAPHHYPIVRAGLERMRDSLALDAVVHEAIHKLADYLNELDRRFAK